MFEMAETKQISATVDIDLANWIIALADREKRSYSQMIEILLEEARIKRETKKERIR
jgi:hypothetical protein